MMNKKSMKFIVKKLIPLSVLFYFFPLTISFFLICGIIDALRNSSLRGSMLKKYFFGNGLLTWLMSPINLFIDLLCKRNHKIYTLNDFPEKHKAEITALIDSINQNKDKIKTALDDKIANNERTMFFFKWYGMNIDNSFDIEDFHKPYRYIKTIGVSIFNKNKSTSWHFGPLRLSLRLLYNLSPSQSDKVFIQVGGKKHYWHDDPLFIFDDTLYHRSLNESDDIRYCMFVDIARPSIFPRAISFLITLFQKIMIPVNKIFYKNWVVLK